MEQQQQQHTATCPVTLQNNNNGIKETHLTVEDPNSGERTRKRSVLKNGECNVVPVKISTERSRFMHDIFTTLVDLKWRWTLLVVTGSFVISWLVFGCFWYLICYLHGDFEEMHLPVNQEKSKWTPCVYNIDSFTSSFLFSMETQTTLGYGMRTTSEQCTVAVFLVCFQALWGIISTAFAVGIVFAKLTRPKQRAQTVLFSKNAVICRRDGNLCLMFRIGDLRKSHIIGASVRAQLVRRKVTKEGEIMAQYLSELDIQTDDCQGNVIFIWPMLVVHHITPTSPFWKMTAKDFQQENFEIIVSLEGTVETTGSTKIQARSSYLNSEILWGYRFEPIVSFNAEKRCYETDYSRFNALCFVNDC
ncbi:G protein-activated inward rectifier potassium channel 4-like [Culicoides brevitarsis]|uniref:G protein-activated inward rectifier potassium channel 4-like n=1 Tax=Culicoides brevitarsis TaxID=469753 RepID=UPI00307BAFDA